MNRDYLTFVDSPADFVDGQEVDLFIRDLKPGHHKYNARYVRAVVSSSLDQLRGGDTLWLRSRVGTLYPSPWSIKITRELGEYASSARSI